MLKLRLKRLGRKKSPFYRIVVTDVNNARSGKSLAELGTYDPLRGRAQIDGEQAQLWLRQGAQMTPTVKSLFSHQGILAQMQGAEGTVQEDALMGDKPKRRRKLAQASAAPAEEAAEEAPAEEASETTDEE